MVWRLFLWDIRTRVRCLDMPAARQAGAAAAKAAAEPRAQPVRQYLCLLSVIMCPLVHGERAP